MTKTDLPAYETIVLEMSGQVAILRLDRPDQLNAMPPAMADDICAALTRLPALGARCLLVTGNGRGFCSGAELGASGSGDGPADTLQTIRRHYNPMLLALAQLDIPVVAAVNGAAAGIGCSLALSADFTLAGKSAYFLQAFVNVGLIPDGGSSWWLPRLIGFPRAMEMMMLGERIGAERAAEWGLIHRCVDDGDLAAEAEKLARRLAAGPTVAYGTLRRIVRAAQSQDIATVLDAEAVGQSVTARSQDAFEGVRAFREKRKAVFEGR
ncbi:MAG: enoyl-CoA hydratase/isomerase family protein [Sphingopyxis sp.]|nr:enoyl-CoA hydratase/isomerase family protein [Sphingopyxis sp.]